MTDPGTLGMGAHAFSKTTWSCLAQLAPSTLKIIVESRNIEIVEDSGLEPKSGYTLNTE